MSPQTRFAFSTKEGRFSEDGQSFIVSRPDTPHPLVNVISTGAYGVAIAQTGAGCSWGRRLSEPVTRGSALFTRDAGGRALYLRDEKSGRFWSAGWQPLRAKPDDYECVHGVGYTLITSRTSDIQAQWLVFVPCEEPLEVWRLRLKNHSKKARTLSLWSAVEWASQRAAVGSEGAFVHGDGRILLAKSRPGTAGGWEGVFFHGVNLPTRDRAVDRRALWGAYGSAEAPEALVRGRYVTGGPEREPFASLCLPFTLKPGEERSILFTVGWAEAQAEALLKARKFQEFAQVDHAWNRTQMFWDRYLSSFTVDSPDAGFNLLVNSWLKYQSLSQGLWGGRGPRDARVLLSLEPARIRREILARAAGVRNPSLVFSDTPWPVLLVDYLKETGDARLLNEKVSPRATVYAAAGRAIKELLSQPSRETPWVPGFLSDWADMILWAEAEGRLPAGEKASARRMKADAARLGTSTLSAPSRLRALEEACRRGKAKDAWTLFQALTPLPPKGLVPPLFSPELAEGDPPAAALFRVLTEGFLGIRPAWNGLRIRPCLPPSWRRASAKREFRGALATIHYRRNQAKPAGFQEIVLNGRKIPGDVLPVMFGRKNEVIVTVGRAA